MERTDAVPAVDLRRLYDHRFSSSERARKDAIWEVLCRHYFQRFIDPKTDVVLDLASGLGEFSRHIRAGKKIAVDLNPESRELVPSDASFFQTSANDLSCIATGSVDVVFSSHFLEHLPNKAAVDSVLHEVHRVLRPGGRYIALQPNLRLCKWTYWDYHDHQVGMSDRSCEEAFAAAGFRVKTIVRRFLPYSTKGALPTHPLLVRLYLAFAPAWWVLGKTFLIVGQT